MVVVAVGSILHKERNQRNYGEVVKVLKKADGYMQKEGDESNPENTITWLTDVVLLMRVDTLCEGRVGRLEV